MIEYMIHMFDVVVINAEGVVVSEQQLMGSTSGLNVDALEAGIYTVEVYSEGGLTSKSQILKRDT